jgi:Yippee zinc-binding/DNA-binding /Mis18, centromere assembly
MGKDFFVYLDSANIYVCKGCKVHFSCKSLVISKNFTGKFGRAFLVQKMSNVVEGPDEEKMLLTGVHVIRDIFCKSCNSYVGWSYVKAYEFNERYKEGKYIMERNQAIKIEWEY